MEYSLAKKLAEGQACEKMLDRHFNEKYDIKPVSRELQRYGLDRIFIRRSDGTHYGIEYKCDNKSASTQNIFIETISVDKPLRRGWAYTSIAQRLIYYVPPTGYIYIAELTFIRSGPLAEWIRKYPERSIPNEGYMTKGILVPLSVFEATCDSIEYMRTNHETQT